MSILTEIKRVQLQCRKDQKSDPVSAQILPVLTTLLSEASMIGKNSGNRESTDGEVIAVIKKMIVNNQETIKLISDKAKQDQLVMEIAAISQFLPRQFTSGELEHSISIIIEKSGATSAKDVGMVMKLLKQKYEGLYDGQMAAKIVKEKLQ